MYISETRLIMHSIWCFAGVAMYIYIDISFRLLS